MGPLLVTQRRRKEKRGPLVEHMVAPPLLTNHHGVLFVIKGFF